MFDYRNVYFYRYTPLNYGKLSIFDQYPLMIPLLIQGSTMLGLNLHWIPVPLRLRFVQFILQIYNKQISKEQFHLWYYTIKSNPMLNFSLMAIRKYYISHCSNVQIVPGEQWNDLPTLWNTKMRARYLRRSISTPTKYIGERKSR